MNFGTKKTKSSTSRASCFKERAGTPESVVVFSLHFAAPALVLSLVFFIGCSSAIQNRKKADQLESVTATSGPIELGNQNGPPDNMDYYYQEYASSQNEQNPVSDPMDQMAENAEVPQNGFGTDLGDSVDETLPYDASAEESYLAQESYYREDSPSYASQENRTVTIGDDSLMQDSASEQASFETKPVFEDLAGTDAVKDQAPAFSTTLQDDSDENNTNQNSDADTSGGDASVQENNTEVTQEEDLDNLSPEDTPAVRVIEVEMPNGPMSLPNGNYTDIGLDEAIRIALENSEIIRGLGGAILRTPETTQSIYNPSIAYSNPLFGEEAALSEFDASLSSSFFFEKNDEDVNNQFLGTNGSVIQDLGSYRTSVDKRTAYGTSFSLRAISDYDFNNSIGNRFGNPSSSWSQIIEGEARQPLLRGLGSNVNRIAGGDPAVGEFNGIRIAMLRTDISVTQFRIAVRDLVADVENAYWDLYFAYRDLEAKKAARDNALKSWQVIKTLANAKKEGGEADKEGQAREQYFRFEADVQDAMFGRKVDATRTRNGSTGGTFRPTPGVRVAERRLRRILGMQINGSELLKPADEPTIVAFEFDWDNLISEAETNRAELKIQEKRIEQLSLSLLAARNMTLPQLDVIGRYRMRGFGKDWVGSSPTFAVSAWEDFFAADHQEWQAGFEFNMPFGFRQARSAVSNLQQQLMRERQMLFEQQQEIEKDLSDAVQDLDRAFNVYQLQYNRLQGALDQLKAVEKTNALKKAPVNLVLEAQRRVLDAQTQLFRAKVEYVLALRNIHVEKGTLLEDKQIFFADSVSVGRNQ